MFAEESPYLTTIKKHIGLLRYLRLQMGISCESEIFTEAIRVRLVDLLDQLNMKDVFLVFGKTIEEHPNYLMAV